MGEKVIYQQLTAGDRISVILYRAGIVSVTLLLILGGIFFFKHNEVNNWNAFSALADVRGMLWYAIALYASVGLSAFTIHLYVKKFRLFIRWSYVFSAVALIVLFIIKGAEAGKYLFFNEVGGLSLLPLSICTGFIAAKEAFCFRLNEGYIIAILLPVTSAVLVLQVLDPGSTGVLLSAVALLMLLFAIRKVPQPLAYDIGDKSVYEK
ncbi:hypothetical protein BMS3Abin08_01063 [bacterium BMS3Abin08]|nr:hypothetical protein BMS3Abin08_01063 [bacterium BMS3Abin08]